MIVVGRKQVVAASGESAATNNNSRHHHKSKGGLVRRILRAPWSCSTASMFMVLLFTATVFTGLQLVSQHHLSNNLLVSPTTTTTTARSSHNNNNNPRRHWSVQDAARKQPAAELGAKQQEKQEQRRNSNQKHRRNNNHHHHGSSHRNFTVSLGQEQQHRQNKPGASSASSSSSNPGYHVVFSTSCAPQQHWESMVFFYHAHKVQQPGTVTRIVSGCTEKEQEQQAAFFQKYIQPTNSKFHIHFTPDFSKVKKSNGAPYKYMNKPYGLRHWMEHGPLQMYNSSSLSWSSSSSSKEDDIVILMDPDMILLRPLTHDFTEVSNHLFAESKSPRTRFVRHGFPMAQQDGYLSNAWMSLNLSHVVGPADRTNNNTPIAMPPKHEGFLYWNTGPPYLVTVRDMYQIVQKWTEYTPRVLDLYPKLFAEMFGFIFASVALQLRFTMIKSIVVSTTTTSDREGWAFVDKLTDEQVCNSSKRTSETKLPIVLHYCERYMYGPMFFSKYRLKKNIMDCDKPLLEPPPSSFVGQFDYSITPPRADGKDRDTYKPEHQRIVSQRIAKREAFMLCGLTHSVNAALIHHKQLACPAGTANLEMTYTIYNDPGKD
ncbi:hypothetical protein ACA910_008181 [Epithemia clementina (nom. ined.)]